MKIRLAYLLLAFLLFGIGLSCSRKKDKWVNRAWHDVTTKNNTLYNGRNAFTQGRQELIQNYRDNFWEVLPVERMIVSEDVRLPNEVLNQNFDKAEEKSVKAIQKHSMLIDNRERNPKMDEAFMLLGKARYFEQRFVPALEAFNYILYKYPTSNSINQAKVWKAKTNARLDNNEKAIEDLKRMIKFEYLNDQDYADALSMIAQAYINLKEVDSAITYITKSAIHTKNNEEKGRYYFIKGQLLDKLGYKDSANYAYKQVIDLNRKTPRRYLINAHAARARNFNYELGNKEEFLELLTDLEENRENRPFLDIIYYQKAEYFKNTDSIEGAVAYYNKSLRTKLQDRILESKNYINLGNFSFDAKEYAIAGAYYDSTLERLNENSKKFRVLKRKRDNLDDVILYDGIARKNDSILRVVAMSDDERLTYFKQYADSLKAIAIKEKEAEEAADFRQNLPPERQFQQPGAANPAGGPKSGGTFYFYNPTTVAFGKSTFKRLYGNRELQDNWRIAAKTDPKAVATDENIKEQLYSIDSDPTFDPLTYIAQVPGDPKVIDSLQTERNFAYYQLGIIYKEKFQEYDLAIDKLENLLESNPEEKLVVPSKYNLFKIYQLQGKEEKAATMKANIINNHLDSRYAKVLLNPDKEIEDEDSPEAIYNSLYAEFKNQNFAKVIAESNAMINKFEGEAFIPKFELLKAQAIGRFRGFEPYEKALNYVALNYPQSPEGKKAQLIIETTIPQIKSDQFTKQGDTELNNKIIYAFDASQNNEAIALKQRIEEVLQELRYDDMKVSVDAYTIDQQFVVVHTRRDRLGAQGLAELLEMGQVEDTRGVDIRNYNRKKKYYPAVKKPYVVMASPNYRIVQIHKNLDQYDYNQQETK
ncbi:tetratricopeptide repeat protein [Aquimarina brevivitae]|uniref:Protein involved in gliding motility SprE n=1 Tax=Aquimarina brevivitae TaxID=323412 RepID=A0A4Q7PK03_9FLAO|nr:hypothetical protein [Aquimarina brevivitae]RZS99262.1 protein involved in gliding motility SprE [Aquimarina brevivitae]